MCGRSGNWMVLDNRGWGNGPTGQPSGASIFDGHLGGMWAHMSYTRCWPPEHSIIPRQPMDEIRAVITQCLDEDAMQKPLYTVWDMFAWPDSNKNNWKEDCLSYSPGATVDLSSRMPGIWLALHDEEGRYQGVVRVLKFVGHMLVYDPQMNGAWMDCDEGSPLIAYSGRIVICKWSRKLLPLPICGAGGPKARTTIPSGTNSGVCTDWGWITTVYISQAWIDLPSGTLRRSTLKRCRTGLMHWAPCGHRSASVGWGSGGNSASETK